MSFFPTRRAARPLALVHQQERRDDRSGSRSSGGQRSVAEPRVPSYNCFMPAWAFVVAVASALVLGDVSPGVAQNRALRVGVPALPAEVDPSAALDGPIPLIARQVFDTLVQYTDDGSDIEPGLAAHWSVSKDGLVWSFQLRAGVSFHDGTTLSAQHVVDSLSREIRGDSPGSDAVGALLRGTPGVIRQVRARDARTVEIALSQAYAPLLTILAHPVFSIVLPATGGANRWQGTGPFGITEIAPGRIVLEAKPASGGRRPRLSQIVFVEANDAQAESALAAQQLDVYFPAGAPPSTAGAISIPGWRVGYLALQTEKEPFKRVKARQAVAMALDPALLTPVLGPLAVPLQGFLPPGVWARRAGPPVMEASPERARQLLWQAGLGAGASASLLISDAGGGLDRPRIAEAIRTSLVPTGLTVTVRSEPAETARGLMQAGDLEMALAEMRAEAGDPHFLLYPISTSEGAAQGAPIFNFSFYRNPRLDDLLIRATQLSFRPERERLYLRAQALLAEELPWIPLYVRLHWAMVRPEVKGLQLHPSGNPRLDRVWLETSTPVSAAN
jgi:peptide/nickel transport system substrate-binding protein